MLRLEKAGRLFTTRSTVRYILYHDDYPVSELTDTWLDVGAASQKWYVVQTSPEIVQRCILMTTDPGDLVLDPTCGSGTTAFIAELWGRRWITIDTSRVALALARARLMGARFPYYLLADSREGDEKRAAVMRNATFGDPFHGDIRQGFVYERVPHITLRSIANNSEIDVIWDEFEERLRPLRSRLNKLLGLAWNEWDVPYIAGDDWPDDALALHEKWWETRKARQKAIDASISAKAEYEYLYDKPYIDNRKVRVAGPFTVESVSPHRVLGVSEHDDLINQIDDQSRGEAKPHDFSVMILENLARAGVQQAHKENRISFDSIAPWPGDLICAVGQYTEGRIGGDSGKSVERRAAIFIGPEFGTVTRPDLVEAAREAADSQFDILIACAFNYEAHTTEFEKLGRVPILKARMNADLHMADDLKNTGKGNLFVIFGEPDIELMDAGAENDAEPRQMRVRVKGVDVFDPSSGEVRSDGPEGIACWFVDTDYNQESFFVRHAYFLGQNDPYKSLKTTLKAEINEDAWATLSGDVSRPFDKPEQGRIAVKVINHLGDEVMKVFKVD